MKKIFTLLLLLSSLIGFSQSTTIVISQFYGAGGNSGAILNADYVELHNISNVAQSLNGFSIQYESATPNGTWGSTIAVLPNVSVPSGGFYLVQLSTAGTTGAPLPTADFFANVALGGSNGIVALLVGTTVISGCPATNVVDLVGYGTATCYEGSAATPAVSAALAGFRAGNGCTDTNDNAADFTTGTPSPRNSASTPVFCGSTLPTLVATGTINDFNNVIVGTSSPSQSYSLSGTNLTGAPGNIVVSTGPSNFFELSTNNTTWSTSVNVPYASATLAPTTIYVRFSPQNTGTFTQSITNTGGGETYVFNVTGTAIPAPTDPLLTAGALTTFGNVCLNTTAGPNSFTINGVNLTTADVTVGPLAGYSFSTAAAGTYTPSLTLTQTGGAFTQEVFVKFTPTAIQSYNGNIAVAGGGAAAAINVAATGAGNNAAPSLTTGAASAITINSATVAGTITADGCTAVTAYGIEYSLTSGFANGTGTAVPSTNLTAGNFSVALSTLAANTFYYYKAYATNTGGTSYGTQQSFKTAAPVLAATPLTAFGNTCLNTTTGPNSFSITSTVLGTGNVTVGPLAGYTFSTSSTGTYTNNLSITQPGGAFSQTVFVKFTPTVLQSYNGNIPVGGGGANSINVPASGAGVNTAASVTAGSASNVSTASATLTATVTGNGCSNVTSYGIEYSGINNFVAGSGTTIAGSTIDGSGNYAVNIDGLVQGTTYYYRAYATNAGGNSYSVQASFTTATIPAGLTLYSIPAQRNNALRFSVNNIKPDHYAVVLFNSNGQKVFRKDMIIQTNFINDAIMVPNNLTPGVYQFQLENNNGYRERKTIMIK